MNERKSPAPTFPDAEYVGPHLVIDKTEWVPGRNPEPHLREDRQTTYPETYFRCIRCGAERLRERDFPDACAPDAPLVRDASAEHAERAEDRASTGYEPPTEFDATGVSD